MNVSLKIILAAVIVCLCQRSQWEEIIKYRMHIGDGFRIIKDGNNFVVEYLLTKNKVASNMFSNCINLKNLTLPERMPRALFQTVHH